MQYIVKHTYTATADHPHRAEGEQDVWYIGKNGHSSQDIRDFTEFEFGIWKGWKRKQYAEQYISRDAKWYEIHGDTAWKHTYEIIAF